MDGIHAIQRAEPDAEELPKRLFSIAALCGSLIQELFRPFVKLWSRP
jgi:hypothetical protein